MRDQNLTYPEIKPIRTGGGTDLAFAVMVLAAYFTTFSSIKTISVGQLVYIIILGIAYIAIGVYGYAYCATRNSFPLVIVYFIIQISLGEAIIYLGGTVGFNAMILLPLAGHSVVLLPEFPRYIVNGVIVFLYALTVRWMSGGWDLMWTNLPIFIAGQVFILVFTQMAVSEEMARNEIQYLVKDLEAANQRLREFALQAEDLAVVKERNRMAREIHDGLGHHLTALNMQIKAARAILPLGASKVLDLLSKAEGLTQTALIDVRNSVSALRTNQNENKNLIEQVENALQICRSSGMETKFKVIGEPRPSNALINLAISRAAQECVNNMIKHSGATLAAVELDYSSPETIRFSFQDNGIGTDYLDGGFGLIGMKERVVLLDGEIVFQTAKGEGFNIEINLPG